MIPAGQKLIGLFQGGGGLEAGGGDEVEGGGGGIRNIFGKLFGRLEKNPLQNIGLNK